jgi:hypothetical protein
MTTANYQRNLYWTSHSDSGMMRGMVSFGARDATECASHRRESAQMGGKRGASNIPFYETNPNWILPEIFLSIVFVRCYVMNEELRESGSFGKRTGLRDS